MLPEARVAAKGDDGGAQELRALAEVFRRAGRELAEALEKGMGR